MRITVCSIFRNSAAYLPRYFLQIDRLRHELDVRLVLAEGDSRDGTGRELRANIDDDSDDLVLTIDHGGPAYGSVDLPERWAQIATVVRGVTAEICDPGDVFVWVESDLIWQPETIVELVKAGRPAAPKVLAEGSDRFYDTWGFRQGGYPFSATPPYLPYPDTAVDRYVPIDSCGSCFAVPAISFDTVKTWDGMWPFTAGGGLALDTESTVWHP